MRQILTLLFIVLSLHGFSQAKIASDGSVEPTGNFPVVKEQHFKGSMRTVVDTTARNAIPAQFRSNGMLVQTITPFTLWRLDSSSAPFWKPFVSATTSLSWDSIIGRPANFSTTYALSNDLRDSLDDRFTKAQSDARYLQSFTELDPTVASHIKAITTTNISNWNTAVGWGNHAGLYRPISYVPAWTDVTGRPTSLSEFTNDVGFISGINSTMVTNALGYTAENIANKGVANGYADLDANGRIPASRIDFGQTGQTFVVASQAEMLAVPNANIGALAIRTDQNKNYRLIALPASNLSHWIALLSAEAPVQSVNGQTGNVNLLTTNISEGTNLYYTDTRARGALSAGTGISYNSSTGAISSTITQYTDALARGSLSFVAGQGAYNSSTGVITIPTNTTHLTNDAGFITGINSSIVTTALGYTPVNPSSLGSYAYRSSGLAELSGATFTGVISGTSATFSSSVTAVSATLSGNLTQNSSTDDNIYSIINRQGSSSSLYDAAILLRTSGTNNWALGLLGNSLGNTTDFAIRNLGNSTTPLRINYSTSAATFSSSVTATQFNGSGAGLTGTASSLSIGGNAATVTNGVYTNGSYANPAWITSLEWSKITGAPSFLTSAVTSATGTANQITVSASTGAVTFSLPSAVTISGNMTAASFFESSDIRQKKVHKTLVSKDGIDAIQYTFLPDGKSKWGYSAQQVKNIIPFAVTEGTDGFLKVDYTTIHTFKIASLEKRIVELEKQLNK